MSGPQISNAAGLGGEGGGATGDHLAVFHAPHKVAHIRRGDLSNTASPLM